MTRNKEAGPSRMRHSVTVQVENSDDGDDDPTYTTFMAAVPCNIVPVGGSEVYRGRQLEATVTHLVYMRRLDGMLPTMRLYEPTDLRTFEIVRVLDVDGRRINSEVQVTEKVA